jgi:prepilin-type N-terminal cleavage/methylation domain-containing protein
MRTVDPRQAGFSMVELLVAMVITLMVSGAIFGLLTGGQNAFRREPEMTDRQQNVRVAMDLIKRDVAGAGAAMAPFVQAFTNSLDAAGGNPTSTQTTGAIAGTNTDILEMLTTTGQCPSAALSATATAPGPLTSAEALPNCYPDVSATNSFFYVGSNVATELNNYGVALAKANVAAGTNNGFNLNLTNYSTANYNPVAPNPAAGFCTAPGCRVAMPIDVVRYQVAPDPDDPSVPALWRSTTGTFTAAGAPAATPGAGLGTWQVVARGIEDLQVDYMKGAGTWDTTPGSVYCAAPCTPVLDTDLARIVRQVRVRLSARATGKARIQGGRAPGGGNAPSAIRGELVSVIVPRAALKALSVNPTAATRWY